MSPGLYIDLSVFKSFIIFPVLDDVANTWLPPVIIIEKIKINENNKL